MKLGIMPRGKTRWIEAGFVGVNSGSVLIMDPVDAMYEGGKAVHKWLERLENLDTSDEKANANFHPIRWTFKNQFGQDIEHEALISRTEFGDGNYRIWAKLDKDGRVQELRIRFDVTYGYEKEGEDMHDISTGESFKKVVERQRET